VFTELNSMNLFLFKVVVSPMSEWERYKMHTEFWKGNALENPVGRPTGTVTLY
jgi:hypothetical protein